jgi:glycosyltransferase involved in cell wall biosynthesis
MEYSIVIPVHNEAAYLERQVTQFIQSLPADLAVIVKEILLVENGSTDETLNVCRRLEFSYPSLVRAISIARGSYGEAIKRGMLESSGTHLSILECDVLDSDFVMRSVAVFRTTDIEVIVGSKRHPDAVDRRPFKRRALTYLYNIVFLRLCMGYPGTDTHGLKSFQTPVAQKLCREAVTTDEVFQTEMILLAWRGGSRIKEIPINIGETRDSAISVRRRLPKVIHTVHELRASLNRFPPPRKSEIAADLAPVVKTSVSADK